MEERVKKTSVRLPIELYQWLSAEAGRQDRTMHSLMVHALREYMKSKAVSEVPHDAHPQ